MRMEIVDGYCHCGLSKYRPIGDVRRFMKRMGISRSVLVQHLGEYDNSYIEQIVSAEPDRFAGVFLVDVGAERAQKSLDFWAKKKEFRGIRLLAHTLEAHPKLWEQVGQSGLNIVLFEELTSVPYVEAVTDFLKNHPTTKLILSHFGRLDPHEFPHFKGFDLILTLADYPNAFLQVSGMDAFAPYPYKDLVPLVQRSLETFGPDRILYGSNYPVGRSPQASEEDLKLLLSGKLGVPADCLDRVLRCTASNLWFNSQSKGEQP